MGSYTGVTHEDRNRRWQHRQTTRHGGGGQQRKRQLASGLGRGRGHSHGRWPQAGGVLQALCALGLGRWIDHTRFQIDQSVDHSCEIGALHQQRRAREIYADVQLVSQLRQVTFERGQRDLELLHDVFA